MAKEPYSVAYHVVTTIYLEKGRELSGPDFAKLWSSTRLFGKQKVVGGFWTAASSPQKIPRVELGSLEYVQPLIDKFERPVFGGGTWSKRNTLRGSVPDVDFYYAHSGASRCFGYETLPLLLYAVSGQWVERVVTDSMLENIREHFAIADKYAPPYGLVDVSAADNCYGGMAYVPFFFLNCHLHRWIEHERWLYACTKRRDQARGIYWGNYFGSAILERLGGRQQFVERYRQQICFPDGKPDALIWEFPNGVFISVSKSLLGSKPGPGIDGPSGKNARWLVHELGSRGVLDPWSK